MYQVGLRLWCECRNGKLPLLSRTLGLGQCRSARVHLQDRNAGVYTKKGTLRLRVSHHAIVLELVRENPRSNPVARYLLCANQRSGEGKGAV